MDLLVDYDSTFSSEGERSTSGSNGKRSRCTSPATTTSCAPTATLETPKSKRRRGSVTILSAKEAPADLFQRTVPHKRGHWAGHVFVPVTDTVPKALVERHVERFRHLLERHGYSGSIVQHSHLHLSLSKYFSLQLSFLDSFVDKLNRRLATERPTRLFVDNSDRLGGTVLVNDERTRSFWTWKVSPNASLRRIVQHIDAVLKEYNKPLYYDPPTFHVSVASFAGDLSDLHSTVVNRDLSLIEDSSDEEDPAMFLYVDNVVCNFGTTKSYSIPLVPP